MHSILSEIYDRLGDPPRRFDRDEWPDLLIPEPAWAKNDDLAVVFDDQRFLYKEGEVVWGAYVQANRAAFRPGPADHPGTLVYSRHPDVDDDPTLLMRFASRLHALKDRNSDDPDEQRYGDMLRDEFERAMRWRAPPTLTDGLPVYSTSVMACRKHLPGGLLARTLVPILRHRDTVATLIVPHWFWPRSLAVEWAREAAGVAAASPDWVTVTPAAAAKLRELAVREKLAPGWCARLWIDRGADGRGRALKLDLDVQSDEAKDRVFHIDGVTVAMDRREADELRGAAIGYYEDERQRGFTIG
jgi:iron-sulfur cluster assembly protein